MRIARFGGWVLGDLPGLRIEPADVGVAVPGIPHHAFLIHDQIVRQGALFQLIALEVPAFRLEVSHIVPGLTHEPHAVLTVYIGVSWAGIGVGNGPFFDGHLRGERSR
jgi:hypothetical protein